MAEDQQGKAPDRAPEVATDAGYVIDEWAEKATDWANEELKAQENGEAAQDSRKPARQ